MDDVVIRVEHVSKVFKLPREKNTSIKSAVINFYKPRKFTFQKALDDVSFDVQAGEFFGIIGRNGGGKSTLLKLLAGIYTPTKGGVHVRGKLSPFIELGVGFNPELTGRENVFLNGALLGFSRKEMLAMYKDIVEFAELQKFMDQKLKNYSSGMQVRLAFSIAIRAQSDILLIDEVLAVGDANFQKKCIQIFRELKRVGKTIVFVSHSMGYIKDFCDRVLVINEGKAIFDGNTNKAVDIYNKLNLDKDIEEAQFYNKNKEDINNRLGSGGAKILKYEILDGKGNKTHQLQTTKIFSVRVEVEYLSEVKNPVVGVMFRRSETDNLFGLDNDFEGIKLQPKSKGDKYTVSMEANMPLAPGEYFVSFSVVDAKSATEVDELDVLDNIMKINVISEGDVWGLVRTPTKIIEKKDV